jgi:hypothetical protein
MGELGGRGGWYVLGSSPAEDGRESCSRLERQPEPCLPARTVHEGVAAIDRGISEQHSGSGHVESEVCILASISFGAWVG